MCITARLHKPLGLLINFGSTSLQFKKIYNPKYRQNQDFQDFGINKINANKDSISKSNKSHNPVNPDSDK